MTLSSGNLESKKMATGKRHQRAGKLNKAWQAYKNMWLIDYPVVDGYANFYTRVTEYLKKMKTSG